MRAVSGAGASVSAGANFQARVAAYLLATAFCDADAVIAGIAGATHISFEMRESVDDLGLSLPNGEKIYIQAKASITFSLANGELRSVFSQFERQDVRSAAKEERYFLATTSRASQRVVSDLRQALDIFRHSPAVEFFRDQPTSIKGAIEDLRYAIGELCRAQGRSGDLDEVDAIIRKSHVVQLDLEEGMVLEQAAILLLDARGFASPRAVWGKLISDCLEFARTRRTVEVAALKATFDRYRLPPETLTAPEIDALVKVNFGSTEFAVGKEVVFCDVPEGNGCLPPGLSVIEFYRFDDACKQRIGFVDNSVKLGNGELFPLLRRAATINGLARHLSEHPELVSDREVTVLPMNLETDVEDGPCAAVHRERLRRAGVANQQPLACVHCGMTVSQPEADIVETGSLEEPLLGLVHGRCLKASDRLLGVAKSPFFEKHPRLINFDINGWFKAAHSGQRAFDNIGVLNPGPVAHMIWGGPTNLGPPKPYVIDVGLKNGDHEIVTRRNHVHRFSKPEADAFSAQLNQRFAHAAQAGDPFGYTDESKGFAPRSLLLEQFGAREKFREVAEASVQRFEPRFERTYGRPGQWYAPVLALRSLESGDPLIVAELPVLLTNPVEIDRFLENWRDARIEVVELETMAILTDDEFDGFMLTIVQQFGAALVDPMLDPRTGELLSGAILLPIEAVEALDPQSRNSAGLDYV